MVQRKPTGPLKRLVWRISEAAPLGEFVDPDAPSAAAAAAAHKELPEAGSSGGWIVSSFELMHGADVSEGPDTVPDELFDELFAPPKPARKPPDPA